MIRVDFLYRLKTQDLPLMLEKFKASGDQKFSSSPSNIKMEMGFREIEDKTDISLNIYYKSRRDYEKRTQFERSQKAWNDIWFKEKDIFEEVSVNIYDISE